MNVFIKFIVSAFLLIISFSLHSQVVVYRTFEDFQNEIGEEYDSLHDYSTFFNQIKLIFKKGKKKVKIPCKKMWGFSYKNALFRVHKKYSQPARVISFGKIVYYENGIAHLSMLKFGESFGQYDKGYAGYFSKSINSEMVPIPTQILSDAKRAIRRFKKEHPEYKELFDCLGKNYTQYNISPCLEKFEEQ